MFFELTAAFARIVGKKRFDFASCCIGKVAACHELLLKGRTNSCCYFIIVMTLTIEQRDQLLAMLPHYENKPTGRKRANIQQVFYAIL
jgi:transposase